MEVNPTSAGAYGRQSVYAAGGDSEIDESEFMQLLITQIQHQDPFEPMDNSEMVSQLNQFSQLDQMTILNQKTDDMLLMSQSLNNTMMLDLVGRPVTVSGDLVQIDSHYSETEEGDRTYTEPTFSDFTFSVASGGSATVTLVDSSGVTRGTYTMAANAGANTIDWQTLLAGEEAGTFDGRFKVEVEVTSSNGVAVDCQTYMTLPVESIRYENNVGVVEVGGNEFYVSEIYEVGA